MATRFRKSIKIAPGVKLNVNKKSVSLTAGTKGAHHTISTSGKSTTSVGIPGSGLSYVKTSGGKKSDTANAKNEPQLNDGNAQNGGRPPKKKKHRLPLIIAIILAIAIIASVSGQSKKNKHSTEVNEATTEATTENNA